MLWHTSARKTRWGKNTLKSTLFCRTFWVGLSFDQKSAKKMK
jgi:hypothetical protein